MCAILDTILVFDMGACRLVSWWEDGGPSHRFPCIPVHLERAFLFVSVCVYRPARARGLQGGSRSLTISGGRPATLYTQPFSPRFPGFFSYFPASKRAFFQLFAVRGRVWGRLIVNSGVFSHMPPLSAGRSRVSSIFHQSKQGTTMGGPAAGQVTSKLQQGTKRPQVAHLYPLGVSLRSLRPLPRKPAVTPKSQQARSARSNVRSEAG